MNTPTRLVQFTDPHLYGDPAGRLRGIETLSSLRATVAQARHERGRWDATLLTGDLVQDDPAGYAHVRAVFGGFDHPVYCLPGNHDDAGAMRRELADAPFRYCGDATLGPWQVVMLDSCVEGTGGSGAVGESELERLDALLAARAAPYALVCLHHHPVRMGSHWLDEVGLADADDFLAVIDRHPAVRGVLWGHVHQAYDGRRGIIRMMGTPSTCAQFKPHVDGFAIDVRPPAYRWLDLNADGTIFTAIEWVAQAEQVLRSQSA